MRIKKRLIFTSVLLSLCIVLGGCARSSEVIPEPSTIDAISASTEVASITPAQRPVFLRMGTGSIGGTYFALGGAIAACLNFNLDDIGLQGYETNASIDNIQKLQLGELDLGFSMNSTAHAAWHGTEFFSEEGSQQDFRAIAAIYPEVVQIVATTNSGATTLSGLAGKRIAVGPAGSGGAVTVEMLVASAGLNMYTDLEPVWENFADGVARMQNLELDANSIVAAAPAMPIIELFTSMDVQFVEVSDTEFALLQESSPCYTRYTIASDVYGTDGPVDTVACMAVLYCRADLDEDVVYQITKALFESADEITNMNSNGQNIHVDNALNGVTTPLHPGAARYYNERGVSIPTELILQ